MNFQQEKIVRFQDWNAEKNKDVLYSPNDEMNPGKLKLTLNTVSHTFQRGFESGSERLKRIKRSLKSCSFDSAMSKNFGSEKKILDPLGPFLQRWNKIFVLTCVIAISLDPLFFYIPVVDDPENV
jgi:cyclic nucleotide gated channel